jgi:hypothetical protein
MDAQNFGNTQKLYFNPNHFPSQIFPVLESRKRSDRRKPEGVRDGGRRKSKEWWYWEKLHGREEFWNEAKNYLRKFDK